MEARELRIGNLVLIDDDLIIISCGEQIDWDCELYQPIPLTEEWLLRFGFVEYDRMGELIFFNYKTNLGNRNWNLCLDKNICMVSFHGISWEDSFKVEFVHELQNLWVTLTKYELELKPI